MNNQDIGYIYKITNPKKKVYIGQTINFEERLKTYKRLHCKTQIKLYNSLKKYGVDDHVFEVLTECDVSQLNNLERYYQDLFHANSANGLNLKLTTSDTRSGRHSEEVKKKLSETHLRLRAEKRAQGLKWFYITDEARELKRKQAIRLYGNAAAMAKSAATRTGIKLSDATKAKISAANKGKTGGWNKGKRMPEEQKQRMLQTKAGKYSIEENPNTKIVLNKLTGIYYYGTEQAHSAFGRFKLQYFQEMLNGRKRNKTDFIYTSN